MTTAVCFKCGAMKIGAFTPCKKCQAVPRTVDDLATAMAITDHYFNEETLKIISLDIKSDKPVSLDAETKARLVESIKALPPGIIKDAAQAGIPAFVKMKKKRKRKSKPR
jgi:hypothetical protein